MKEEFVARTVPGKVTFLILGGAGFVMLGLWLAGMFGSAPVPGIAWLGWLCVLFFGACALIGLFQLFDRRAQIVINASGVLSRQWSNQLIPWSAIKAVEATSSYGQPFLCLYLHDPARYPPATFVGRLAGLNKAMGYGDIAISVTGRDKSFAQLCEAIERHRPTD